MKKPLIILTGPTAVGKTELSIKLAKAINGEIISADSMQVYKKMDIGTAKVTREEMDGVTHYLIDCFDPFEEFNVTVFQEEAKKACELILSKGKIPIVAGGTGFYIQALLYGIDFTEENNDYSYRKELQQLAEEKGPDVLWNQLKEVDEESAQAIHKNNQKKVIRALEYYHLTGKKMSEHNQEERQKEAAYNFAYFVLTMNREKLYHRIDQRVDLMIKQGLFDEVRSLYEEGYQKDLVSMQGIGYKEVFDYIEGKATKEQVADQIKKDTRHFAKRQLTWFRREKEVTWIDKDLYQDEKSILEYLLKVLEERNICNDQANV